MKIAFSCKSIEGTVASEPSKSFTHRAYFLSGLAKGTSKVTDVLTCGDTFCTLNAINQFGAKTKKKGAVTTIEGGNLVAPKETIYAGNSATTLRIATAITGLFDKELLVTGDSLLKMRPMKYLTDAMTMMGSKCYVDAGVIHTHGKIRGSNVVIDGTISSQYISALMIVSPLLEGNTHIKIEGTPVSCPYVNITKEMMNKHGVDVDMVECGHEVDIQGGQEYKPANYSIPRDYSTAAFALVAGALKGEATVTGLDPNDIQGDKKILKILEDVGAKVNVSNKRVTVKHEDLNAVDVNMRNTPDLFPITAVLLATAKGTSTLYGAEHLKYKEVDRIEATVNMINALGGRAKATADGCIIKGIKTLKGGEASMGWDHRVLMATAIASCVSELPVIVENSEAFAISYPGFISDMMTLGIGALNVSSW